MVFASWHFCLPYILYCTFGSAAGSSAGATIHKRFTPYPVYSASSASSLMALLRLIPVGQAARRSWIADFPTKPLHPTSTGWMVAVHPPSLHSPARSEYLNSRATGIPSSHGTVSSIMRAFLAAVTHTTPLSSARLLLVWGTGCLAEGDLKIYLPGF